jgi:Ca-activated chloride channel family protein
MHKTSRTLAVLTVILALAALACTCSAGGERVPSNAAVVEVTANTELSAWLGQAIEAFNDERIETSTGRRAYATLDLVESGQAVANMAAGGDLPALWVPDDRVWANVLAGESVDSFQADCASLAESPLVIAMWRPVAESLGWPGRSLGWLDVGSLAADPSAWAYYSGGQFGESLRLGHTHPGLSATGTGTLLAIVQAAEAKTEPVSAEEVRQPIVQASVSAFEAAVSWFSTSTDALGQTMAERGVDYLGAAVMYESTVVRYGSTSPGLVAIYPFEGTFVATHPACLNDAAGAETQEAALLLRDYLLSDEAQQLAPGSGLRPVSEGVPLDTLLDGRRGVDPDQPEVVFGSPGVDAIYAVQEMWQAARKDVNLVMVLDTSGSMDGSKIRSARAAAIQFVEQMGDDDFITVISFADRPVTIVHHQQVGAARDSVISEIRDLGADGSTPLYDAVAQAADVIARTRSPETTNAMVVLTDGQDTSSTVYGFGDELVDRASAYDTTVFTIAYGSDADESILADLALGANGNFYQGDVASIAAIYQEMSAAFGGSVGVGR